MHLAKGTSTPPESLLVRYIKAHIRQGDAAKERAAQAREKAEQHFTSAGQYLAVLKVNYSQSWEEWEILLKTKVGLSTGRASELMQIADGRKSVQEVRDGKAQSMAQLRARTSSPRSPRGEENQDPGTQGSLRDQCNEETPDELFEEGIELGNKRTAFLLRADQAAKFAVYSGPLDSELADAARAAAAAWEKLFTPGDVKGDPRRLIDALANSGPRTRSSAAEALVGGPRHTQFEQVRDAVADLYQQLAKAGR
jgi:hypothetical protein